MFKKLYEAEYGQLGGEPYGCIIADYYFDHTPPDVDLLGSIAKVAASAHAPFIAGASPRYCKWTRQELANPRDLTKIVTQNTEYAPWNSLRASEDSRYIGLTMPRFLARLPYGAKPTRWTSLILKKMRMVLTIPNTSGATRPTRWA